jgi:calcineurin-like phosphoesterase family protein
MHKVLKFNDPNQKVFFSSDFHAFHNPSWDIPICKMRGYDSWQEMNEDIIKKVNSRIGSRDSLIYLGDFALNSTPEQVEEFLGRIECQNIYLLFGNHESSISRIYKKAVKQYMENLNLEEPKRGWGIEIYPLRYKNVIFCGSYLEIFVQKRKVVCSHFPFMVWNQSHHEAFSLNGHSHYTNIQRLVNYPIGKALDVGWDGKKDVYSWNEILKIMNNKITQKLDHHDKNVK